jgi:enoyl-CoA hydratase/carnithine racemase
MTRKPALEMLLTGEFFGAREAQRRGLVNRVASIIPQDGVDATMLLATADAVLYQAKHTGRNCYVLAR